MKKLFLATILASLIISAGIGIVVLLIGEFGDTEQNLLLTTLAVGGFSLTGLAAVSAPRIWWLVALRPLGAGVSLVGLGLSVARIWSWADGSEILDKALISSIVLAVTLAHLSLLGIYRTRNPLVQRWRLGAMLAAAVLSALIMLAIWEFLEADDRGLYIRAVGIVAILDVLGTIALFPLARLAGLSGKPGRRRSAAKPPKTLA